MNESAANDLPLCERCCRAPARSYTVRMCPACFELATRKLSALQLALVRRAAEQATDLHAPSVPLSRSETPAATGLAARGLVVTRRDGKTSSILASRPSYRKGSTRWMHLTQAGLLLARELGSQDPGGA